MENQKVNIEQFFSREISRVNEKEIQEIDEEIKQMKDEAFLLMEKELKSKYDILKQEEERRLNQMQKQRIGQTKTKLSQELYAKRKKIKEEVFASLKEKIKAFKQQKDYEQWIINKLSSYQDMHESMILYVDEKDAIVASSWIKSFKAHVEICIDETIKLGGFILKLANTNIQYDETLDTLVEQQEQYFYEHSQLLIR